MALIASDILTFPGVWRCRYWYPNTKKGNTEEVSEFLVRIDRQGEGYVLRSTESTSPEAHLEGRFTVDGSLVTGTFMENASPTGDWEGMTYKGAFQLLLNEAHTRMEGLWVAAGYNNGDPKTFTGRWEFAVTEAQGDA
jgi:hypothetical protein